MTPLDTLERNVQMEQNAMQVSTITEDVEQYFQKFIRSQLFEDKLGSFDKMSIEKVFKESLDKYQHNLEHNPYHAANELFTFLEYQIQILTESIPERRKVREYIEYLKEVYTVVFLGNHLKADEMVRNIFCTTQKMVESKQDLHFEDFSNLLQTFVKEVQHS